MKPPDLGANFRLEVIRDGTGWTPLTALRSPEMLMDREENTRLAIGGVGTSPREIRAVASTMALGLFSRLLSPVLGAAATGVPTMPPDPATTWFRPVARGTIPLATTAALGPADPEGAVEHLVLPLVDPMASTYALSRTVLVGNIAAAVAGACEVIAMTHPDAAGAAAALRARLLSTPLLRGTGTPSGRFVRASCCLIWQLPMHYICSNCVLVNAGTRMTRGYHA